ncbi:MAG: hypothetical protein P8X79_18990 [Reinekea sp.]
MKSRIQVKNERELQYICILKAGLRHFRFDVLPFTFSVSHKPE